MSGAAAMTTTIDKTQTREEHWLELFGHRDAGAEPSAIAELRQRAIEAFQKRGFPTLRDEEWRQTNVAPVTKVDWTLASGSRAVEDEVARRRYEGCRHAVFVDGVLVPELSDLPDQEGVTVAGLSQVISGEVDDRGALDRLGRYVRLEEHPFAALNTAFFRDGAFVHLGPGTVLEEPLHLLFLARPGSEGPAANFPRTLIVGESNSQGTIVESYVRLEEGDYFTCPVTEIFGDDGSVIDHYRVQKESVEAKQIALQQVWLDRAANLRSHTIAHGGGLVRTDTRAVLDGEGIDCTLNGIYVATGNQVIDNHMLVEHVKPHCDSHELYKGILDGHARAVFNGLIHVHPGAQKTDAKQTNRNLLLSPTAISNSNPQLLIFADDVKCTHGSTTGHIDAEGLFYLRSRGIEEEAARSLLTYAFASEIVNMVKLDVLRRDLNEFLFERLPGGDVVRQAI